ncbi:MAG: hypothetical protein LBG06_09590 [Deltaproteobacteria bacterium]|jgi:hypothetical protein|nr:hypothetical protein [Deltaproteobacteria bacterium]
MPVTATNMAGTDRPAPAKGARSGLILAFALGILLLMSLMGIVILSNTRTELSIAGNNRLGREAFNSADATARTAVYLTLELMSLKDVNALKSDVITSGSALSPAPRYPIAICPQSNFTYNGLLAAAADPDPDFTKRYLNTGAGEGTPNPHIEFRSGDCTGRVLANAVVAIDTSDPIAVGGTTGTTDAYDTGGGNLQPQVGVVVSVNAKPNMEVGADAEEPSSLITIMYRTFNK